MNVITKYGGLQGDYEVLKKLAKESDSDLTGADSHWISADHREADCCRDATGLFDNCSPTTEMPVTGATTSTVSAVRAPVSFANESL